jgi:outer membrane protein assembly factor BamD
MLFAGLTIPTSPGFAATKSMTAEERYEFALKQMQRGFHQRALEEFNRVRNYHRDDPVSVLAQLAIADLHFKKADYDLARYAYEEFATLHPRHEYLDYVTWQIGLCIWKRTPKAAGRDQSATSAAVNTWSGFDTRFPESEHLEEVMRLLDRGRDRLAAKELFIGSYYAAKGAWVAAEDRARTALARYPKSTQAPLALAMLAESLHLQGMTVDAEQALDRLMADYPDAPQIASVQRTLAGPPGELMVEEAFVRPYRIRSSAGQQQAPQQ